MARAHHVITHHLDNFSFLPRATPATYLNRYHFWTYSLCILLIVRALGPLRYDCVSNGSNCFIRCYALFFIGLIAIHRFYRHFVRPYGNASHSLGYAWRREHTESTIPRFDTPPIRQNLLQTSSPSALYRPTDCCLYRYRPRNAVSVGSRPDPRCCLIDTSILRKSLQIPTPSASYRLTNRCSYCHRLWNAVTVGSRPDPRRCLENTTCALR